MSTHDWTLVAMTYTPILLILGMIGWGVWQNHHDRQKAVLAGSDRQATPDMSGESYDSLQQLTCRVDRLEKWLGSSE